MAQAATLTYRNGRRCWVERQDLQDYAQQMGRGVVCKNIKCIKTARGKISECADENGAAGPQLPADVLERCHYAEPDYK